MSCELLTSDNPLLSRPTTCRWKGLHADQQEYISENEINYTSGLPEQVAAFVEASLAENSRRAYAADLAHFGNWGGTIPASDQVIARYLAEHAETLSVATLVRRMATISKAHSARGLASPTCSELVRATMRGIKRSRGTAQVEARPLLRDDLFQVLGQLGDDVRAIRDRALLLIGFAGGFRRSEIVGLDVEDVEHVKQGIVINLRRSKTDQSGTGRKIAVPHGRTRHCPVSAFDAWLSGSAIAKGPLFRPVNRHGHVLQDRLSSEAVAIVIRERIAAAGMDPSAYSGHSFRAGFATSASMAGASTFKIRAQTGHASDAMLARYIRDGDMFTSNAAGAVL